MAYPYLPDQASYGGPPTHGFNPTPAEANQQAQGSAAHLQLMQRAAMMHPMAQVSTSVMANAFFKDPEVAERYLKNTPEGQITQQLGALVASTGVMGQGRSSDMIYGIQNAVASSGMRMGVEGAPGSQQFMGRGAMTDQLSLEIMGELKKDFFAMGRKTFEARGLDMSDIGAIFQSASDRGVFSGEKMFETEAYTEETIQEDIDKAMERGDVVGAESLRNAKPGDVRTRLSQNAGKIKEFVQDTGDLLGDLKDLYEGLSVEQLLKRAEAITGMGIGEMGGPMAIKNRIAKITDLAKATGKNPQALMQTTMQNSQTAAQMLAMQYGGDPQEHRRTAAIMGLSATEQMVSAGQSGKEGANMLGEHGVYQRQYSDEYRAATAVQSQMGVMNQEFEAVEAIFAADQIGTDPEIASKLREEVRNLGEAETVQEREEIRGRISDLMVEEGFGPSGTLTSKYGGDLTKMTNRYSVNAQNDFQDLVEGVDRMSALEYQTDQAMDNLNTLDRFETLTENEDINEDTVRDTFRDMTAAFDPATLDAIMKADSPEEAQAIMVSGGMDEDEATALSTNIDKMGPDFDTAFREYSGELMSFGNMSNFRADQTIDETQQRMYQQKALSSSLGRHRLSGGGILDAMMAGFAGVGDVTKENAMAYIEQQVEAGEEGYEGTTYSRNEEGGFDIDEDEMDGMLRDLTGDDAETTDVDEGAGFREDIMREMGVENDAELAEMLQTREGSEQFMAYIMENDSKSNARLTKDGLFVTSEKQLKAAQEAMESVGAVELFENLGLGEIDEETKQQLEDNGRLDPYDVMNKMIDEEGLSDEGKNAMKLAIEDGNKDTQKSLVSLANLQGNEASKQTILEDLKAREEELREKTDNGENATEEDKKEMQNIQNMKQELGAGTGAGKKFLGEMRVIMEDEWSMKVWET